MQGPRHEEFTPPDAPVSGILEGPKTTKEIVLPGVICMKSRIFGFFACLAFMAGSAGAQGLTTGAMGGRVLDAQQQPVAAASVIAIHIPSGTTYEATTRADGRFTIPGMRVGGPYS